MLPSFLNYQEKNYRIFWQSGKSLGYKHRASVAVSPGLIDAYGNDPQTVLSELEKALDNFYNRV